MDAKRAIEFLSEVETWPGAPYVKKPIPDDADEAFEFIHAALKEQAEKAQKASDAFTKTIPIGDLPRYGIQWVGPSSPIAVPMVDGYWTPYHAARAALDIKAQAEDEPVATGRVNAAVNIICSFVANPISCEFDQDTCDEAMKIIVRALYTHPAPTVAKSETVAAIHVVFDGPPGPEAGRFVECETPDGKSINAGEWREIDGYWHLIIATPAPAAGGES